MRKKLALLLVIVLTIAMFASCNSGGTGSTVDPSGTSAPTASAAPSTDGGTGTGGQTPSNVITTDYATYEVNENGVSLEPYEYELPLTTEDNVFTYSYTSMFPQ
ncbi:MAG: hypothetical protein LBN43_08615, partial [Oscillospiraceae bacterium]|nr:hypothetical protein [Oscillospiraceae bacterium]